MVGVAVGDALGARFEGVGSVDPEEVAKLASDSGPLRYTDDTHMTLGLARALVERQGFDAPYTAELLARNFEQEPWRGYGSGPPRVFGLMRQGVPWDQAAGSLFGGTGSYGNGGAMRVAPVALFAFRDLDRVARLALAVRCAHAHSRVRCGRCGVAGLRGRSSARGRAGATAAPSCPASAAGSARSDEAFPRNPGIDGISPRRPASAPRRR